MSSSDITTWLDRLLESTLASEVIDSAEFRFGARKLTLATLPGARQNDFSVSLTPWEDSLLLSSHTRDPSTLFVVPFAQLANIPDFAHTQLGPYGSVVGFDSEIVDASPPVPPRWLVTIDLLAGRLLALNVTRRVALFSSKDPLPPREIAEFARPLLHWLAILDGNVVLHAGAVSDNGRGLLVAGAGNAGKTTFVRACVADGMTFHGDNVVEVSVCNDATSPTHVWGAYQSLKVRPEPVGELPTAASVAWDTEAQKSIYFLSQPSNTTVTGAPIQVRKFLTLSRDGGPSVRPLPPATAFFATAPNTVAQFPYFERLVLSRVRQVVENVPTISSGRIPYDEIAKNAREVLQ